MKYRCQSCLAEIDSNKECPICGYTQKEVEENSPVGKTVKGRYYIGRVFSEDSATKVYVAFDNTLKTKVLIREYDGGGLLPEGDEFNFDFETRRQAINRFINYGKSLAAIGICSLFPKILDIFEEDNGYIVTEFFEGENLKTLMAAGVKVSKNSAKKIAKALSDGAEKLHKSHMIFGRICPETVYILKETGDVRLFGLGSPFFDGVSDFDLRVKHINPSYAPPELFTPKAKRGAFTDTYSIAAILYRLLTDTIPPISFVRERKDTLLKPSKCNQEVGKALSNAILNGMNLSPEMRTKTPALLIADLAKENVKRVTTLKLRLMDIFGGFGGGFGSKKGVIILISLIVILLLLIGVLLVWILSPEEKKIIESSSKASSTVSEDGFYYSDGDGVTPYNQSSSKTFGKNSSTNRKNTTTVCPNIVGYGFEQAENLLRSEGLKINRVSEQFSDKYAEGNVIHQNIKEGTKLKVGTVVGVIVSKGPEKKYVSVPKVLDMELTVALKSLKDKGFANIAVSFSEDFSDKTVGTVVEQNYYDTSVEIGSWIYITVAGFKVDVPNFENQILSEVDLSDFTPEIKDETGNTVPETDYANYKIISQSLKAGEEAYRTQKISLTVVAKN